MLHVLHQHNLLHCLSDTKRTNVQGKEACKRTIPNLFLQFPRQYCSHHQECQQKSLLPQVEIICAEKPQNFNSHLCNISVDFDYTEDAYDYVLEEI